LSQKKLAEKLGVHEMSGVEGKVKNNRRLPLRRNVEKITDSRRRRGY
jgi:hypothetical protein